MSNRPSWHELFAPIPDDAVIERQPVASTQQIADGSAEAIAGWDSITVHLSADSGLRHVLLTVDGAGTLLAAGDTVLFNRTERRGDTEVTIYDHENFGGRYELDGSFRGTYWQVRSEQSPGEDEAAVMHSTPLPPTEGQIAALNRLVADVLRRAPAKR
jgi:hypothetical protein